MNLALKLIDLMLVLTSTLRDLGVNYGEVQAAQDNAQAEFDRGERESPELNDGERQVFIDQSQGALDRL